MLSTLERERAYRRRVAASMALTIALQLAAWWLLPSPLGRPLGLPAAPGGWSGGLSLYEVAVAGREAAPTVAPSAAIPVTAPPPAPLEEPTPEPVPGPEITFEPATPILPSTPTVGSAGGPAPGGAAPSPSTAPAGAAGAATGAGGAKPAATQTLRRREWVHPRIPERIIARRKIDDFVLLQVLVAADGRVRDVRVLRDIPNCAECTQSAVEAARRDVYDPPVVPAGSTGVWSQTFDVRFSYRR